MSDPIFSIITEKPIPLPLLKQIQRKLILSNIDISKMKLTENVMEMVRAQNNLEALAFSIRKPARSIYDGAKFGLASVLAKNLTGESLKLLKISAQHQAEFCPGWVGPVAKLLPNLETLLIPRINLNFMTFFGLCQNFRKLKYLDVSSSGISSLEGISNLKSLEVLCIRNIEFESPEDMMDLFECRELRMLDLSKSQPRETKIVENYLKCRKVLENLRILDCNGTDINKSMLEQLMKTHRNLKQVVVHGTILNYSELSGIDLLNNASPESLLKTFQHYISIRQEDNIRWMLRDIFTFLEENQGLETKTQFEYMKSVCEAILTFGHEEQVYANGIKCIEMIAKEHNLMYWTPPHIRFLVDQLVKIGTILMGAGLNELESRILKTLNQTPILECPALNLINPSMYLLSKKKLMPSLELSLLGRFSSRWTSEHLVVLFKKQDFQLYMLDLLHNFVRNECFKRVIKVYRNEIRMHLVALLSVIAISEDTCRFLLGRELSKVNLVEVLLEVLKHDEELMALEILVNLVRLPEFMFRFGALLMENSRIFV